MAAVVELGDEEKAVAARRFFKTGPGQYGEGDRFVGVRVPELRTLAKELRGLPDAVITELLASEIHEVRLLALLTTTVNFRARGADRAAWVALYRNAVRAGRVDNWDLVDSSAAPILGAWLQSQDSYAELLEWAASDDLWERRVGIIGTFAFTRAGRTDAILAVAPLVVADHRDLIQKAFGWMLREMGKRVSQEALERYLEVHSGEMGRTALSYAVERMSAEQKTHYRGIPRVR
ncbi:DNA alkylation repair protein [Gordonia zhaorongruii]|uniref:DNA alkylation repair protein n=1 Tax=Gordonia zhaorongruii TaxID=2597659 RepID=UPI001047D3FB|nr:DNA alkylation repair protein [Gordonia zhaorongruii]